MTSEKNDTIAGAGENKLKSSGLVKNRGILLVLSENLYGKTFIVDKFSGILGRDSICEYYLDDPMISKKHFKITADEKGEFFIEDLGSTNATFLNRKKLKKQKPLLYGDRIVAGSTILRFFLEENLD